jgi:CheY-like chemotaxis protein
MPTLLLADDSVTIRRVIELTFADEGVRVISVGDGASAIAQINAEPPDIVLADVGMLHVDGYQVAAHAKRVAGRAQVPVLLLTGAFEPIDEARARQAGADGVLVKPFEPRHVIRVVRDLLAGERPSDLWPADMPKIESRRAATPAVEEAAAAPVTAPVTAPAPESLPPLQLVYPKSPESDGVSVPYVDPDPDLDVALSRLAFVGVPDDASGDALLEFESDAEPAFDEEPAALSPREPAGSVPVDIPAEARKQTPAWDLSASPSSMAKAAPAPEAMSMASVFSALLAAERGDPGVRVSPVLAPALSDAAIEKIVERVVRQITGELVRKTVLETAERLIREEIARIKS